MLGERVAGAHVLDLFAGSGALGIEALSRGAARATFVELSQACASILRRNLDELEYAGRADVVRADAVRWVTGHPELVAAANLVLLDPPYADRAATSVLRALDGFAASGTIVVAETSAGKELPPLTRLHETRARRYGDTDLHIYETT